MRKDRRGQSTLEYIVLVTAVLATIIFFVGQEGGPFQSKLNSTLGTGINGMNAMAERLSDSL